MRMKLFSAPTMEEAMEQMRAELGDDAVILSTHNEPGCVEVRAAVERPTNHRFAAPKFSEPRPSFDNTTRLRMNEVLRWHGAPNSFADLVASAGIRLMGASADPGPALSAGLEGVLAFSPIHTDVKRSILLVGTPGAGKTSVAAKLAARASDGDQRLRAVSADFDSAGGHARLAAYTGRADIPLFKTPEALQNHVAQRAPDARKLIIDAPAFNPVSGNDMERLRELIQGVDAEPVLVMSAEGHPEDLEDNARAFANAGIRRVILTKLDVVRRRGGAFAAISSSRLSLAQLSLTHHINGGLIPATPLRIARLLLETAPESGSGPVVSLKGAA